MSIPLCTAGLSLKVKAAEYLIPPFYGVTEGVDIGAPYQELLLSVTNDASLCRPAARRDASMVTYLLRGIPHLASFAPGTPEPRS